MTYWPFWLGGLALAGVVVVYAAVQRRLLGVSGRYSALVDYLRLAGNERASVSEVRSMNDAELMAALCEATAAEFGGSAQEFRGPPQRSSASPVSEGLADHTLFLGGLVVGGLVATLSSLGGPSWSFDLAPGLAALVDGSRLLGVALMLLGGILVGFGTRMAGGCTSGHGLSGVSRLQPGSLVATAAFFGAGIGCSFLLGVWL